MNKKLVVISALLTAHCLSGADWPSQANMMQQESLALTKLGQGMLYRFGNISLDDPRLESYELSLSIFEHSHQKSALNQARKSLMELHRAQDTALQEIKDSLSVENFLRLQAEVHFLQYQAMRDLDIFGIKQKLSNLFASYSTDLIKNQINKKNPHAADEAHVQQDNLLTPNEQYYRQARAPYVKKGLEKFFERFLDDANLFTTGFVGTGGGYRAMILTTGYARALEKMGLLDATSYMTSLSGSTWFLAPWITGGKTVKGYKEELRKKAAENFLDIAELGTLLATNPLNLINDLIWPKFIFGQAVSSIDIYGALLALVLFYDLADVRQEQRLSAQWDRIKDGSRPFPIYTSVSMHKNLDNSHHYNWYEFNPIEVRNLDLNAYIPSWSFDSHFKHGKSLGVAPEQSLGYLMGVFGSAYTVNFVDLNRLMHGTIAQAEKPESIIDTMKYKATKYLLSLMSSVPLVGTTRFSPAQVNNPFREATDFNVPKWLTQQEELVFVDAGIDYNIPVRPLLRPERGVNAIIIGESSGNVLSAEELMKFFADAQRVCGYVYEEVLPAPSQSVRFFKDQHNPQAPKIVYVNYRIDKAMIEEGLKDPKLARCIQKHKLDTFDVQICLDEQCSTFNFEYTEEQFLQLSGVGQFNIMIHKDKIKQFLADECLA